MGKKAVVLSGGGAKGGYQIGVWKVLRQMGFTPDIVVEQPEELRANPLLRTEENDVQYIEGMAELRSMIEAEEAAA